MPISKVSTLLKKLRLLRYFDCNDTNEHNINIDENSEDFRPLKYDKIQLIGSHVESKVTIQRFVIDLLKTYISYS